MYEFGDDEASAKKRIQLDIQLRKYYAGDLDIDEIVDYLASSFESQPDLLQAFAYILPNDGRDKLFDRIKGIEYIAKEGVDEFKIELPTEKTDFPHTAQEKLLDFVVETELHKLCMEKYPPETIIEFLASNVESALTTDKYGRIPLHVACKHGASSAIIFALVDAFPSSINQQDNHGRIPLHYYLFRHSLVYQEDSKEKKADTLIGKMMSKSISFIYDDDFIKGSSVKIFTSDIMAIETDSIKLLCNEHLLLEEDNEKITPFQLFAKHCCLLDLNHKDAHAKLKQIIKLLVSFEPPFQENLHKAITSFPHEYATEAVNQKYIKESLNEFCLRPGFISNILVNVVLRCILIYTLLELAADAFYFNPRANDTIARDNTTLIDVVGTREELLLFVGCVFLSLEFLQPIIFYCRIGKLMKWCTNGWHWLQAFDFISVMVSAIGLGCKYDEGFQFLYAFTCGIQWFQLLCHLRPASLHLVLFFHGIKLIITAVLPFAITTSVLLGAFASVFYIANNEGTEKCVYSMSEENEPNFPCTFSQSFAETFIRFVDAQINDDAFEKSISYSVGSALFGVFVVLLNLNILIAILTLVFNESSSDGIRQFWLGRFHYMFYKVDRGGIQCIRRYNTVNGLLRRLEVFLEVNWDFATSCLFDDERFLLEHHQFQVMSRRKNLLNLIAIVIIPIWILFGFLTFGLLLPNQIKRYLFFHSTECLDEEYAKKNKRKEINHRHSLVSALNSPSCRRS